MSTKPYKLRYSSRQGRGVVLGMCMANLVSPVSLRNKHHQGLFDHQSIRSSKVKKAAWIVIVYFQINILKKTAVCLLRFAELGTAYICDVRAIITIYWKKTQTTNQKNPKGRKKTPTAHTTTVHIDS